MFFGRIGERLRGRLHSRSDTSAPARRRGQSTCRRDGVVRNVQSLSRGDGRKVCVKNWTQNPSPVDGETSKKMTAKAWKYDVDFSRVRSIRKGLAATSPGTPPFALVRYVISKAATISTCVKPPHLRDTGRCWLAVEEVYVRHASCSSRMATPCSESR